ncbi:MAG TPA: hypothetical protein EYP60_07075 [bacterium (Candidatus Stahlbacteria)]|nr:hypothetical protein [Candidatus Stahlbacteria bacterium]
MQTLLTSILIPFLIVSSTKAMTKKLIKAINLIPIERKNEIAVYTLQLADKILKLDNADNITVYDITSKPPVEILSDHINSSIKTYSSGYIKQIDIIFQDDFPANASKEYEIRINDVSTIEVPELLFEDKGIEVVEDRYHINNGIADYYIGNRFVEPGYLGIKRWDNFVKDLCIRCESDSVVTTFCPLSWIFGNIMKRSDFEVTHYILSYGLPTNINVEKNKLMISMVFEYKNPQLRSENWDDTTGVTAKVTDTDIVAAEVILKFYRNNPHLYIFVKQYINKPFYNHNGFKTGITISDLDSARVIFGNARHTVLTCTPKFAQWMHILPDSTCLFIRAADNAGHTPFDTLATESTFYDYYVIENSHNKATLVYIPDWKRLAYRDSYTDLNNFIIPRNNLYLGSFFASVASVSHMLSTTGPGAGWIPVLIQPGIYESRISLATNLNYTDDMTTYDRIAETFHIPLIVESIK